jgi:putative ABC transport system ATP-binding protein
MTNGTGGPAGARDPQGLVIRCSGIRWEPATDVDDVGADLLVYQREVIVIRGAAGAGKTSLLHAIAGIQQPLVGEVRWTIGTPRLWRDVALIPQSIALVDELTVTDNISLPSLILSGDLPTRLDEMLRKLGLTALKDRMIDEISVGERQRVMIARAIATDAPLVLADEPTAHQDEGNAQRILAMLDREATLGRACVIATRHDQRIKRDDQSHTYELANSKLSHNST